MGWVLCSVSFTRSTIFCWSFRLLIVRPVVRLVSAKGACYKIAFAIQANTAHSAARVSQVVLFLVGFYPQFCGAIPPLTSPS